MAIIIIEVAAIITGQATGMRRGPTIVGRPEVGNAMVKAGIGKKAVGTGK